MKRLSARQSGLARDIYENKMTWVQLDTASHWEAGNSPQMSIVACVSNAHVRSFSEHVD